MLIAYFLKFQIVLLSVSQQIKVNCYYSQTSNLNKPGIGMNKIQRNNQLILRDYFGEMERTLLKKFKTHKSVITKDIISKSIVQFIQDNAKISLNGKMGKQKPESPISALRAIDKENNCRNTRNYQQTHHCSKSSNSRPTTNYQQTASVSDQNLMTLFLRNQEKIMDQQEQLGYMRKQRQIQFQMTRVFLKEYMKNYRDQSLKENYNTSNLMSSGYGPGSRFRSSNVRKQDHNSCMTKEPQSFNIQVPQILSEIGQGSFNNGVNFVQSVAYEDQLSFTKCSQKNKQDENVTYESKVIRLNKVQLQPLQLDKIGSQEISHSKVNLNSFEQRKFRRVSQNQCLSDREMFKPLKYQYQRPQEHSNEKSKVFLQLRKLEKFVFDGKNSQNRQNKQNGVSSTGKFTNVGKTRSRGQANFFNLTQSPTKQYYKEQNESLKTIQSNLNTHIELMQKFRDTPPSLESIVARQEAARKKMQALRDLQEVLRQKEINLNKQQAGIIRKQKSSKVFLS